MLLELNLDFANSNIIHPKRNSQKTIKATPTAYRNNDISLNTVKILPKQFTIIIKLFQRRIFSSAQSIFAFAETFTKNLS